MAKVYERWGKRVLDVTLAAAALLMLSPVFLVVAAAVWLCMGRPVLFQQRRAGRLGKPFMVYKFRTMTEDRGPDGRLLPDEERLTRLGRFLRRWSLDELPQLWNVVRGEMSLVGPRPLPAEYVPLYSPDQARRLDVRPGLVCLNGLYDRNGQPLEKMFHYDVLYTESISLRKDLGILFRMIPVVLSGNGIHRGRQDENSDLARRLRAVHSGESGSAPR
ncbi:MAG: sugar transferase [Bryobacteraceae bacterium]|nr:sugar transferase [Bryobacteraceae bacterium]